jgi:cell division protein FtsW (lipid II flippase)
MRRLWQQLAIGTNWPVLVAVAVLASAGVLSIWADSPGDGPKQLAFIGVAFFCLVVVQGANYQILGRYAWPFYIGSLGLVFYTVLGSVAAAHGHALPGVHPIKGACCWITLPGFSLEPSELMKIAFVVTLARYLRFRTNYRSMHGMIAPFLLAIVPMVLILKQPDLGVAALFLPALVAMLFVAGAKVRHMLAIFLAGAVLTPVFWLSGTDLPVFRHLPKLIHDYQRARVDAMLSSDPKNQREAGFQQEHALQAMGSGGITGKGPGNIPLGRHVPEAHNDMIFSIIGEQFGLVGSIAILAAYIVLFAAGIEIAAATREPFGRMVAVGIVALLAAQAFLNLMVVMRIFPVTGVTLPFVSYGGSSLVASFVAAGLLLNIGQNRPLVIARSSFEFA